VTVRTPDLDTVAALIAGSDGDNSRAPSVAAACTEVSTLEVRWIFPGELEPAVAGWFARFPARAESREDTYQVNPQLCGLSVKIRGNGALEVKAYRGGQGILEVPGRARGHIQAWRKWSFPVSLVRQACMCPRRPGNPRGARARPRAHTGLAQMVLSGQPGAPGPRCPRRLEAGTQDAAAEPVRAGQR
jgi:hypothetical protein